MASSRLEKIGTIYTRVEGLMRSGAMRPNDRPIWWDVYRAYPPTREPLYARPIPNNPIKSIMYHEDVVRAKFHKSGLPLGTINLPDEKNKTQTQQLIGIYNNLKAQTSEENGELYEQSLDMLQEMRAIKSEWEDSHAHDKITKDRKDNNYTESSISSSFSEAQKLSSQKNVLNKIFEN